MEYLASRPSDCNRSPTQAKAKQMKTPRYSLRTLLVGVAIVAAYFPLGMLYHRWFSTEYSPYYVSTVLASKISNGDSVNEVASYFSSQRSLTDAERIDMQSIPGTFGGASRVIEDGDECYSFSTHGRSGIVAQFRDGRLINLPNESYSDLPLLAEMNGYSLPSPILRFGFLPLYLILVACIALLLASRHWILGTRGSGYSLAGNRGG